MLFSRIVFISFLACPGLTQKTTELPEELPEVGHDFGSLSEDYYHNFVGTIICRDNATINGEAQIHLKDYAASRDLRDRFDFKIYQYKAKNLNFIPNSATFNFWAFSWTLCTDKLYFLFYDVCYEGHQARAKAVADGHGLYIL